MRARISRLSDGKNRQTEEEQKKKNHHRIGIIKLTASAWATGTVSSPQPFHRFYLWIYICTIITRLYSTTGRTNRKTVLLDNKSRRAKYQMYEYYLCGENNPAVVSNRACNNGAKRRRVTTRNGTFDINVIIC